MQYSEGSMTGKRVNPQYQAQAILSRRDHSVAEVRQKLARKGFSAKQIEATITWLTEQRLLNDRLFAQRYVESVLATKAVGRRWLTAKLRQKRVSAAIIDEVLAETVTPQREREAATAAVERWRRAHPQHAGDTVRLQRFLLSRGFSTDLVREAASSGDGT